MRLAQKAIPAELFEPRLSVEHSESIAAVSEVAPLNLRELKKLAKTQAHSADELQKLENKVGPIVTGVALALSITGLVTLGSNQIESESDLYLNVLTGVILSPVSSIMIGVLLDKPISRFILKRRDSDRSRRLKHDAYILGLRAFSQNLSERTGLRFHSQDVEELISRGEISVAGRSFKTVKGEVFEAKLEKVA